jgi:transcriptional regulator with XRE-family HTH domain
MKKERKQVTLRLIRGRTGKTQADIVEALRAMGREASQTYVSKIEAGNSVPSVELTIDLAVAYEVTIIEMIEALGYDLSGVWHDPED